MKGTKTVRMHNPAGPRAALQRYERAMKAAARVDDKHRRAKWKKPVTAADRRVYAEADNAKQALLDASRAARKPKGNPMVTWVTNPKRRRGAASKPKGGRGMAKTKLPPRHRSGPKKGQFRKRKRRRNPKRKASTFARITSSSRTDLKGKKLRVRTRKIRKYSKARRPKRYAKMRVSHRVNPRKRRRSYRRRRNPATARFGKRAMGVLGLAAIGGAALWAADFVMTKAKERFLGARQDNRGLVFAIELGAVALALPFIAKIKQPTVKQALLVGLPLLVGFRFIRDQVAPRIPGGDAVAKADAASALSGLTVTDPHALSGASMPVSSLSGVSMPLDGGYDRERALQGMGYAAA